MQYGSGLRKAQDFQLELTRGKRAQGRTYVDPRAGNELFGTAAEAFIMSPALDASAHSRASYLSSYRASIKARFASRTLGRFPSQGLKGTRLHGARLTRLLCNEAQRA